MVLDLSSEIVESVWGNFEIFEGPLAFFGNLARSSSDKFGIVLLFVHLSYSFIVLSLFQVSGVASRQKT